MKTYWVIKNIKKNKIANIGRIITDGEIWMTGSPKLYIYKKEAKKFCYKDEIPIKVILKEVK